MQLCNILSYVLPYIAGKIKQNIRAAIAADSEAPDAIIITV